MGRSHVRRFTTRRVSAVGAEVLFGTTRRFTVVMLTMLAVVGPLTAQGQDKTPTPEAVGVRENPTPAEVNAVPPFECDVISSERALQAIQEAVRRGEIVHPALLAPALPPALSSHEERPPCSATPTSADIFPYEDSSGLLLTDFSNGQLFALMTGAANAVIAQYGDNFDFIAFWVNFTPHHTIGTAFYLFVYNDVSGIGLGSFDNRPGFGLASNEVEGYVMMWNINSSFWQPGTVGNSAKFTRLVLGQEFEHRFGMFLPDLLDGRTLQGDDASCGRSSHWNFKVDGQGSGMEIREWIGSAPATLGGDCVLGADDLCFNSDTGGVWSYADLYLMGYVSAAEMDAGKSELRYMDSSCASPYGGVISSFSSADVIATAGPRSPDSTTAQKNFRTAWVMIHQPGDPPSSAELDKAAEILAQHTLDWAASTLNRGTMCNTLFDPTVGLPKFSQRPTGAGEDVPSNIDGTDAVPNVVVADDFVSDGRPITAVRWWGSNFGEVLPPGPTDDCNAKPEVNEGTYPYNNMGTNTDGPPPTCAALGSDMWANYVPTCTGTAEIHTCGSFYDTAVEVFDGCVCSPTGTVIACNDDAVGGTCPGTLQSYVSFGVTAGECFKVRVGGWSGSQGNGTLTITCTTASGAVASSTSVPYTPVAPSKSTSPTRSATRVVGEVDTEVQRDTWSRSLTNRATVRPSAAEEGQFVQTDRPVVRAMPVNQTGTATASARIQASSLSAKRVEVHRAGPDGQLAGVGPPGTTVYRNEIDPASDFYIPGTGERMADPLQLASGACDVVYYSLRVFGQGSAGAPSTFSVQTELWNGDPCLGSSSILPDTQQMFSGLPNDGETISILEVTLPAPVTAPDTVWLAATLSNNDAGWIIAERAEIGFTDDLWSENDSGLGCTGLFFGGDPYAGFWATVNCNITGDPPGACCDGTTCSEATEPDCVSAGRTWLGAFTDCDQSPCLLGACCSGTDFTTCTDSSEANCPSDRSLFHPGLSCDQNPCQLAFKVFENDFATGFFSSPEVSTETWADDLRLSAGAPCELAAYSLITVGDDTILDYNAEVALWTNNDRGTASDETDDTPLAPITGTERLFGPLPGGLAAQTLLAGPFEGIQLPEKVWLVLSTRSTGAGPLLSGIPNIGSSRDAFAVSTSPTNPDSWGLVNFGGFDPTDCPGGELCNPAGSFDIDVWCYGEPPPEQAIDGWFISFHEMPLGVDSQRPPLALYFCDADAVTVTPRSLPVCDSHPVEEYFASLADCCLVHANPDSRTGSIPAQKEAFFEEKCLDYAIDIQAVVGHTFTQNQVTFECEESLTGNTAEADFWGWHTTETLCGNGDFGVNPALQGSVKMGAGGDWLYGSWDPVVPVCSQPHMAFELLTDVAPTTGDANGNCVPDQCECTRSSQPQLATLDKPTGKVPYTTNRFLPVQVMDLSGPGRLIRVQSQGLAPPFGGSACDGQIWWAGPPYPVCEKANQGEKPGTNCESTPGQPKKRFHNWYADLVCDQALAYADYLGGTCQAGVCVGGFANGDPCNNDSHCRMVYLKHECVVPSARNDQSIYEVRVVANDCPKDETDFSDPLVITQPKLGDLVGIVQQCEHPPPDAAIGLPDVNALLAKFANDSCQIKKARGDIRGPLGGPVDNVVSLPDINAVLFGFTNPLSLNWAPPPAPCGP